MARPSNEQARVFDRWWAARDRQKLPSKAELARRLGVSRRTVVDWFAGRHLPDRAQREKLYALGVPRFGPDAEIHAAINALKERAYRRIESEPGREVSKKQRRQFVSRILDQLVGAGVGNPADFSPALLVQNPPGYSNPKVERHALGYFGRFMVAEGFWSPPQGQEFEALLSKNFPVPAREPVTRRRKLVALVRELVINCGLSGKHVRSLRLSRVDQGCIRLDTGQVIPIHDTPGWQRVSRSALDAWNEEANPQDYVFYQRRPLNYHTPVSRKWIVEAAGVPTRRSVSTRLAHFHGDFWHFGNLRQLRLHLRYWHGLSDTRSFALVGKLVGKWKTFPIPVPYLLVMMCASQLLPCSPTSPKGGWTRTSVWPSLLGRYEVSVTWPAKLAQKLTHRQTAEKVARTLLRLGMEYSLEQIKIHAAAPVEEMDRELLRQLKQVRVVVRDLSDGSSWSGSLFQARERMKYFTIGLLEQLEGGLTNGRCHVCRHPNRETIDAELRRALTARQRHKGFAQITRRWGVPYDHLLWHAGRLEGKPAHVGVAPAAPALRVPRGFVEQSGKLQGAALISYAALLLERQERPREKDLEVSPDWLDRRLGFCILPNVLEEQLKNLVDFGLIPALRRGDNNALIVTLPTE